ncbi:MAG: response regulator [Cyanobacteria bacterium]|nr:response regulator [Cyanobacteriota bacterium]
MTALAPLSPFHVYTILHVDDEIEYRRLIERKFRKLPYIIVSAENSHEALQLAQLFFFDLVILDISLPDINGFSLLKQLRKIDPQLPVVLYSGLIEDFVHERCQILGCELYIEKTTQLEDLATGVNTLLQKKELAQYGT